MFRPVSIAFLGGAMGPGEIGLVFLAVLVLFGPKRLPEIARSIGKVIHDLQRASQDFRDEVMQLDQEPPGVQPTHPALPPAAEPDAELSDERVATADEAAPPPPAEPGSEAPEAPIAATDEAAPPPPENPQPGKAPDDVAG